MATARLKARSHEKAQRPTLKARMVLPNDCWSMSDARPSPTTRMGMAQRRLWTPLHPRTKNRMRRWTETAQTRQQTNHTSSHSAAASKRWRSISATAAPVAPRPCAAEIQHQCRIPYILRRKTGMWWLWRYTCRRPRRLRSSTTKECKHYTTQQPTAIQKLHSMRLHA